MDYTETLDEIANDMDQLSSYKSGIIERLGTLQDVNKESDDESKDAERIEAEINKFHESYVNIVSRIATCSKNLQNRKKLSTSHEDDDSSTSEDIINDTFKTWVSQSYDLPSSNPSFLFADDDSLSSSTTSHSPEHKDDGRSRIFEEYSFLEWDDFETGCLEDSENESNLSSKSSERRPSTPPSLEKLLRIPPRRSLQSLPDVSELDFDSPTYCLRKDLYNTQLKEEYSFINSTLLDDIHELHNDTNAYSIMEDSNLQSTSRMNPRDTSNNSDANESSSSASHPPPTKEEEEEASKADDPTNNCDDSNESISEEREPTPVRSDSVLNLSDDDDDESGYVDYDSNLDESSDHGECNELSPSSLKKAKTFANMSTMTSDWFTEEDETNVRENKPQFVYLKRAFMAALPFYFFIFIAFVLTEVVARYTFEEKFSCLLHNNLHYSFTPTLSWDNGPPPS